MPSVVHVVTTRNAAGVERYVCTVAAELARRGWQTSVVGGDPDLVPALLPENVRWLRGGTGLEALRSLRLLGKQDICHAHMTVAEAVAVAARPLHRAPVFSTRHFAAQRGSTVAGRAFAPLIAAGISREIAISDFVASRLERKPDAVLKNAVPLMPNLWTPSSRVVLVLQRLDDEKDSLTALRAWEASHLWEEGWSLRVAGAGRQRDELERWAHARGLRSTSFVGWIPDVTREFTTAGMLLASAPSEPFGLSVVEGMAAGVPVVAAAGGGHLETVALLDEARLFQPGDAQAAAAAMRSLLQDANRAAISTAGRKLVASRFSIDAHVDRLVDEYFAGQSVPRRRRWAGEGRDTTSRQEAPRVDELVFCSLETWNDVWRRNQFFVDIMLKRNSALRVLFVEPPTDPLYELSRGRRPEWPRLRTVGGHGSRLMVLRPVKVLPRRVGPAADALLRAQVRLAARRLRFLRPTLWINDVTYAPLIRATGWPSLYDVTDDWLSAPFPARELARLTELEGIALKDAHEVMVCSESLVESRGRSRHVHLVPNAVDVDHFRQPRARPDDLPVGRVAVYVGTLHESRLDLDLISETAKRLSSVEFAFVGPNALQPASTRWLARVPNVHLLGARPYNGVPAYLQHADVIIIPHRVTSFTESLDPIKAYECLAVGTPTVSTPVAGFRDHAGSIRIASAREFPDAVGYALSAECPDAPLTLPSWESRVVAVERVLASVRGSEGTPRV